MSYIGAQSNNRVSPNFVKENFTGTGSTTTFNLTNEVPGGNPDNILVVVNNVIQEPSVAYTIGDNSDNQPKVLTFTGTPENGDDIYVVHRGIGTFQRTPPAGSVDTAQLGAGLEKYDYRRIFWNWKCNTIYTITNTIFCKFSYGFSRWYFTEINNKLYYKWNYIRFWFW